MHNHYLNRFMAAALLALFAICSTNTLFAQTSACKWEKIGVVCTNKTGTQNFGGRVDQLPVSPLYNETAVTQKLKVKWWYDYTPYVPHPTAFSGTNDRKMFGFWKLNATMDESRIKALAAAAKASPYGAQGPVYWYLNNEPNVPGQATMSGADYAPLFKKYRDAILAGDPTAKIVGPAMAFWNYWWFTPQGRNWYMDFRRAYQALYGQWPKIDAFNIHLYDFSSGATNGINQNQIKGEYNALIADLNSWPEMSGVPIWVTEFGITNFNNIPPTSDRVRFVNDMYDFFAAQSRVERVFWFEAHPDLDALDWTASSSLMNDDGTLTGLGAGFADMAQRWKDGCGTSGGTLTLNCPPPTSVTLSAGTTCQNIVLAAPVGVSTCSTGAVSVQQIGGPTNGSCFPVGTHNVCFKATDNCGNTKSCCTTVTVNPAPASTLTLNCPTNIVVTAEAGATCKNIVFSAPTASSTCTGGATVTQTSGSASGSCFPVGTHNVCFKATDNCGNTRTCCMTITVNAAPPTGTCGTNLLTNTGFESSWTGYTRGGSTSLSDVSHGGSKSGKMESSGAWIAQTITGGAGTYTFAQWSRMSGSSGKGYMQIVFENSAGAAIGASAKVNIQIATTTWTQYTVSASAPAGTAKVRALVYSESSTSFRTDDWCLSRATLNLGADDRAAGASASELRVFPNPASGDAAWLDLSAFAGQSATVRIVSLASGQTLRSFRAERIAENEPLEMDLTGLPGGAFALVAVPDGGSAAPKTLRLVIQ